MEPAFLCNFIPILGMVKERGKKKTGGKGMDVFEAVKSRRSSGNITQDPVPDELIEKVLEAATWAPSHHKTEPWHFYVITGEGRKALGKVYKDIAREKQVEKGETNEKKLEKAVEKAYRAPVVIAAVVEPNQKEKVLEQEEHAAVNAAIQNMLLAAHALGLRTFWRTGEAVTHPSMQQLLKLDEKAQVLGLIYLGMAADKELPPGKRKPVEEVTTWLRSETDFE